MTSKMGRERIHECDMSRGDRKTIKRIYLLWFALCLLIFATTFYYAPDQSTRHLFSDQAAHIAAALSIVHDGDLRYTLADLMLFRKMMPAEHGPLGLFLKTGKEGDLYYAKPFLYALFAAPFVAFLGLKGFTILNIICFFSIGAVFFSVLFPRLGAFYSILTVFFLMLFSPFIAWIPIAHPDLFVAALLSIGGYLLLCNNEKLSIMIFGSFILGMAVYEKINFIIILPFLWVSIIGCVPRRHIFFSLFFIFIGLLLLT
jgi:hypothetical protein